jgi:serine/threonine protein kinase
MAASDDQRRAGYSETVASTDPVIGSEVSGYRVTNRLGVGGMGIVYEGEQPVIGKRVAIKVLRPEVADNPEVVQRLVSEARAVNRVGHRGIVDVFGFGQLADGRQCIVMEYLEGEPLEYVLRTYRMQQSLMPTFDALVVLEEVLAAVSAAHEAGVVHRDLKPSNVFLCRQRDGTQFVKLLDFGIAKLGVLGQTTASRASLMVGTPAYMAPEQATGGLVSPAMDLYAIGCLAFELFAGRTPFEEKAVVDMLVAHATRPPPRLASLNMSVPDELDELIDSLLAKEPADRPQSAEQVRREFARIRNTLIDATSRRLSVEVPAVAATLVDPPASVVRAVSEGVRAGPAAAAQAPLSQAATLIDPGLQAAVAAQLQRHNSPAQVAPSRPAPELAREEGRAPAPRLPEAPSPRAVITAPVHEFLEDEPLRVPRSKVPFVVAGVAGGLVALGIAVMVVDRLSGVDRPVAEGRERDGPPPVRVESPPAANAPAAVAAAASVKPPTGEPPAPARTPSPLPVSGGAAGGSAAGAAGERRSPGAEAPPRGVPAAAANPRVASLQVRVKRIEANLHRLTAEGENVAMNWQILKKVKQRMAAPGISGADLESLEVALARMEEETSP